MNESVARVFDRILRGLGLKTLNAQFLLSYALMFGLAACASVALYLSMSISPETINVAGARMLSQKAREALQRLGAGDPKALAATIAQYERSAADLDTGNAERNVSRMGAPEIAAQRQKVAQIWGRYRAMLDQVAQPASQVDLRGFSQYSTELLGELNNLVSLMSARADSVQHADVDRLRLPVGDPGAGGARPAVRPGAADAAVAWVGSGADRGRRGELHMPWRRAMRTTRSAASSLATSGCARTSAVCWRTSAQRGETDKDVAEALEQALGAGDQVARQHQDLDQVATAMNEMSATVAEVARHANHAAHSTRDAAALAHEGRRLVEHASSQTGALAEELEQTALALNTLHQHAGSVGQVLTVISSIAEQTNLLALNAAIEAARAGRPGAASPWWRTKCVRWPTVPSSRPRRSRG